MARFADDVGPGGEGLRSGGTVVGGWAAVAAEMEKVVDRLVDREESLHLAG